ncbi:hypothetical protein [Rhodanobacter thiooxydans]|uniref:hypothetical protein n=1 Tax=Rhodanobacter thiooxydans TaxID=416169 RepID=UPI000A62C4D3|nr:hypothetical protein [Rhodanobacter thiooxydans]UJJ56702.1 hypothetical protein LRK53_19020 [Rhodanobacter thiooxydans]
MSMTPRYEEWRHLRETGVWSAGVPDWARGQDGRMNDHAAAVAVIEELAAIVSRLRDPVTLATVQAAIDAYENAPGIMQGTAMTAALEAHRTLLGAGANQLERVADA